MPGKRYSIVKSGCNVRGGVRHAWKAGPIAAVFNDVFEAEPGEMLFYGGILFNGRCMLNGGRDVVSFLLVCGGDAFARLF